MALNVNRSVTDPFYRYKMPQLQVKIESKGNGIKTVIANMIDIAKALDRPPIYLIKFFGYKVGALTIIDKKNERFIVGGKHEAFELQNLLDVFIKDFVLCPHCDNPETVLAAKHKVINIKCKACGHANVIYLKHKLSSFIIKNPPPSSSLNKEECVKKQQSYFCTEDCYKSKDLEESDEPSGDWLESAEASENTATNRRLVKDETCDKPINERIDMLYQFFVKAKKDKTMEDTRKLFTESVHLNLQNRAPLLLADIIFDTDVQNQIETYKKLLYRFLKDNSKAQRHFLGGIEQLFEKYKEQLLSSAPFIIKKLYDEGLVGEKVLLNWGKKPRSKYVKKDLAEEIIKHCRPFLKRLQEMEKESSCD